MPKKQSSKFKAGDKVTALKDFQETKSKKLFKNGEELEVVSNNVRKGFVLVKKKGTKEQGLVRESILQLVEKSCSESSENSDGSGQKSKQQGAKGLLSQLGTTTSGAISDFIAGVNLPPKKDFSKNEKFVINLTGSKPGKPVWAQTQVFQVTFGKRQASSKFAGFKKFVNYAVIPSNTKKKVMRRYKHFKWLWDQLQERYPVVAVPDLPGGDVTGHDEVFIETREQKLLHWINKMSQHPVISQSEVFKHFVTEKEESNWKKGKRKSEDNPFRGINSYLIFTGDATTQPCLSSKRVLPALEAYCNYATEIHKRSKDSASALRSLTKNYRGSMRSSYTTLGFDLNKLGGEIKKGLGGHSDLIFQPNRKQLGSAFEVLGSLFCKIGNEFELQPEKDLEKCEKQLRAQAKSFDHLSKLLRTNNLARETFFTKATNKSEGSLDRLTQIHAATLAEINHIQVSLGSEYLDLMKTVVSEHVNFYKSLVELLEPQLAQLNDIVLDNQEEEVVKDKKAIKQQEQEKAKNSVGEEHGVDNDSDESTAGETAGNIENGKKEGDESDESVDDEEEKEKKPDKHARVGEIGNADDSDENIAGVGGIEDTNDSDDDDDDQEEER